MITTGIVLILASFCLVVLSLMNIFPKLIALPLLLGTIVFTVHTFNHRHRFKGFHGGSTRNS
ncbi:hypothetical protein CR205_03820 [Alteribacter lacisalsi]|uniref:Uncharacterized protein n=2 Tax=Alteribacter lacisalsi TaxID=2045244 RepID=A0A2W0HGV1_9BACI|nr:hypothetical protein [Alteribacter lacisalsi]PYZ99150.1 hypothetical protein CR205_03820 [Alteribacter lacisalsi]